MFGFSNRGRVEKSSKTFFLRSVDTLCLFRREVGQPARGISRLRWRWDAVRNEILTHTECTASNERVIFAAFKIIRSHNSSSHRSKNSPFDSPSLDNLTGRLAWWPGWWWGGGGGSTVCVITLNYSHYSVLVSTLLRPHEGKGIDKSSHALK